MSKRSRKDGSGGGSFRSHMPTVYDDNPWAALEAQMGLPRVVGKIFNRDQPTLGATAAGSFGPVVGGQDSGEDDKSIKGLDKR